MPRFVRKAQSIPVETFQLWQKNLDENRIYMFSNLSAFFEENDTEQETMNRTILSVKEQLKILEEKISRYFLNLPNTPFVLARSPFIIKVEDVPENAQEEFIELITSDAAKMIFLQCQLPNFGSRVCSHILFCLRSHCA